MNTNLNTQKKRIIIMVVTTFLLAAAICFSPAQWFVPTGNENAACKVVFNLLEKITLETKINN